MKYSSLFFLIFLFHCFQTIAEEWVATASDKLTQMDQGGTGLLQMPTARMTEQGSFYINYADIEQYRFWSVNLQLYPWLQATARYTDVRNRLYSSDPGFSGDQTYKDKGLDIKVRLLEESYYLPSLSVGFRDFGGTGLFTSEFVAASKRWGDFDFHLGLGWGYLGTNDNLSNPFCDLADRFCDREDGFSGEGGKIEYQKFFTGTTSLFGGIEYQTPWEPLTIKLEYEGNDYSDDFALDITQDSKWNFGANYRWNDFIFGLSYQRGNTFGFNLSYNFNLNRLKANNVDEPPISLHAEPERTDHPKKVILRHELYNNGGFSTYKISETNDQVTIYGRQLAYEDKLEAIDRTARVIASRSDETVKNYKIVDIKGGMPLVETVVSADKFKEFATKQSPALVIEDTFIRQDVTQETLTDAPQRKKIGFSTNAEAFWTQAFGSPEDFYIYQLGMFTSAHVGFPNHFTLSGTAKISLLDNYDKFNFTVDSQDSTLPRVRTYIREYITRSDVTLENLYLNWQNRIAPNTYALAYAGYLESMFGGIGGEVLYRPVDTNWAFGVDLNYVKQRDYDSETAFFDYKTLTGHANIYWQPEFLPDTQLTFNVGKYLAKDKGATIDFAKRFDSGVVVGAWAALTDASAEEYGEGSFSKGFYITIPFDLFSVKPSRGKGFIPWIPIGRDGGQSLVRPVRLISVTSERSLW